MSYGYAQLNAIYRAMDKFNFANEYPISEQIHGIRVLLENSNFKHQAMPSRKKLQTRLQQLRGNVNNRDVNFHEINDIYLEMNFGTIDDEYARFRNRHKVNGVKLKDISSDAHNVHNSAINNTVKDVLINLFEDFKPEPRNLDSVRNILSNNPKWTQKASKAFKFIEKSDVHFNINITLRQMLCSVMLFITTFDDAETRHELYTRIVEELHDMDGHCSTGYMSRIASIMQGYTENPRYTFSIDTEKIVSQTVRNSITDSLKMASEEVIDGIVDRTPEYLEYIDSVVNENMENWIEGYGEEFREQIEGIINEFKQEN